MQGEAQQPRLAGIRETHTRHQLTAALTVAAVALAAAAVAAAAQYAMS